MNFVPPESNRATRRMRHAHRALAACLAFLALFTLPTAGAPPGFNAPKEPAGAPVQARLLPTQSAIVAGEPFTVGVHLHMDEGWHTYWKNGGDAGLATTVEWELPEGFSAGPLQWPTPHRYVEAGDLVTFGYSENVVLFTQITPPSRLKMGREIELKADVTWLMCKDLCIPGQAEVGLKRVVAGHAAPETEHESLLSESRGRLPRAPEDFAELGLSHAVSLSAVPVGQGATLALGLDGMAELSAEQLVWFPEYREELLMRDASPRWDGERLYVDIPFEVESSAPQGVGVALRGVLELRPADAHELFVQIDVPVRIASANDAIVASDDPAFADLDETAGGMEQFGGAPSAGGSLLKYLLLALVGGIILNIMPCVLPVLSLKVLGFVQHADQDRSTVLRLGLVFTLGVLFSFLTLALVVVGLQAAGELLGWGFQFQNPVFVVVMCAVVFGFGLSLFGVYEIVPPFGGRGGRGQHSIYAESFFNGILATILATPCSAPFLGTALGFAFTQPAVAVIAIFLTIGLGLSLPYLLLSLNPAWLRFVPRPGAWMERFKQVMGFLLMATLVWLLWVLGKQLGSDGVIWTMAFLLAVGFALWLHGSLLSFTSSSARKLTVWVVSIAIVSGAWVLFLHEPLSPEARAQALSSGGTVVESHGLQWVRFSPERLESEVKAGSTVFLDFTAAWCLTCKANEKTVLAAPEVTERLKELDVVTMMGDWTNRDPVISQMLRQFGRSGVPFYAIFPAGRLDEPIVLPELINKGMVLDALQKAGPSRASAAVHPSAASEALGAIHRAEEPIETSSS